MEVETVISTGKNRLIWGRKCEFARWELPNWNESHRGLRGGTVAVPSRGYPTGKLVLFSLEILARGGLAYADRTAACWAYF